MNEYKFSVRAVECSKCNKQIGGQILVEKGQLKVVASVGFKVYQDGVICGSCDDTQGKGFWRKNTSERAFFKGPKTKIA